ncbi:MAG: hypothetical protein SWJ54_19300 [Cyanobacteriota bacterium]|nr:hypothetical protein [Cyanobacteriota bacterium]
MSQDKKPQLKCPLNKKQQQAVKKLADTVDKHKQICKKLHPLE